MRIQVNKPYRQMLELYDNRYNAPYCISNQLFIVVNKRGEVRNITRQLVDYSKEIVETDYNLIIGSDIHVESRDEQTAKVLNDFISTAEFQNMLSMFIIQGLVLGDSFIRFSIDDDGNPALTAVRLDAVTVEYEPDYDKIARWFLTYNAYTIDGKSVRVEEIYSNTETIINIDGKEVKRVPNTFGTAWLIHAINLPSLRDNFFGESELNNAYTTIDEINSTYSRISAIEEIYAKPRLIVSGLRDKNSLNQDENVWAITENSDIRILEYQGDIIPSLLKKVEQLEEYLKSRFPELALSNVRETTGYALRLKLVKLLKKIEMYRKNYFSALEKALKLVAAYLKLSTDFSIALGDILPNDIQEEVQRYLMLYNLGIISRKTVSEKLGLDFSLEQERLKEEGDWRVTAVEPIRKAGNAGKTEIREGEEL